jgi:glycine cleavage system H protein
VKTFEELDIRAELLYSETHEWARAGAGGNVVRVGVDDYAQSALGDIVYVEPPSVGDSVTAGAVCGSLESTKAVSDINSPVTGHVSAVNEALSDSPELINSSPYEDGWIFDVEIAGPVSLQGLMTGGAYSKFLGTLNRDD